MATVITKQTVISAASSVLAEMRPSYSVPNPRTRYITSTGNLAFNALKMSVTDKEIKIYVDPHIAPYVAYTNEPWTSPRRHGKENPNEGWWQRFAEEFAAKLANALKGELK